MVSTSEKSLSAMDFSPNSVSTQPGFIVFNVMLYGASSSANAFVKPIRPDLELE